MTREQIDNIIAAGGVNPNRDTLYRVGSADPSGFYTQSQMNNEMSGTDANAIYQATHDQRQTNTWNDTDPRLVNRVLGDLGVITGGNANDATFTGFGPNAGVIPNPYDYEMAARFARDNGLGGQIWNNYLREQGFAPDTGRQVPDEIDRVSDAYVTGADARWVPGYDEFMPQGVGTMEGIPEELISPETRKATYAQILQRLIEQGYNPQQM